MCLNIILHIFNVNILFGANCYSTMSPSKKKAHLLPLTVIRLCYVFSRDWLNIPASPSFTEMIIAVCLWFINRHADDTPYLARDVRDTRRATTTRKSPAINFQAYVRETFSASDVVPGSLFHPPSTGLRSIAAIFPAYFGDAREILLIYYPLAQTLAALLLKIVPVPLRLPCHTRIISRYIRLKSMPVFSPLRETVKSFFLFFFQSNSFSSLGLETKIKTRKPMPSYCRRRVANAFRPPYYTG